MFNSRFFTTLPSFKSINISFTSFLFYCRFTYIINAYTCTATKTSLSDFVKFQYVSQKRRYFLSYHCTWAILWSASYPSSKLIHGFISDNLLVICQFFRKVFFCSSGRHLGFEKTRVAQTHIQRWYNRGPVSTVRTLAKGRRPRVRIPQNKTALRHAIYSFPFLHF